MVWNVLTSETGWAQRRQKNFNTDIPILQSWRRQLVQFTQSKLFESSLLFFQVLQISLLLVLLH